MSNEKIKIRGEEFRQSFKCCNSITAPKRPKKHNSNEKIEIQILKKLLIKKDKPKRPKKDNSKKGDIFLNCRCCGVSIRPDWYSRIDQRYCADCL